MIMPRLDETEALDIETDFLTGAYRRHTKTKPLRDVDIMIVLKDRSYLSRHPHEILEAVRAILAPYYGSDRVWCDRFAVRVDFGLNVVDDVTGEWIATNPKIHEELATAPTRPSTTSGNRW
jgi:hypothetical protein